jgi:hypothetical protein
MNGLKWSWPALKATGLTHTVETPGGRRPGFLVRSTTSNADLGYIWPVGNAWMWRTPDGKNHGERSSQTAAVRVLRDAYDLRRTPALPFDEAPAPRAPRPPGPHAPGPQAPSAPQRPRPTGPRPSGPQAPPAPSAPGPQAPRAPGPQAPRPTGPPAPAPPMTRIVWADQAPDLTGRLAALLDPTKK